MSQSSGWSLDALEQELSVREVCRDGSLRGILYTGEPFQGKATEVFAWIGVPEQAHAAPGIVCLHGGGGRAFKEWVARWVAAGYAAISMDFGGCGPDGLPLANGGPAQGHEQKFAHLPWRELWTYHAIAAAIRGHTILRREPGVDPARIGVTGISWGGYLTCIAAGVDPRYAFAAPVYGCGFLRHGSAEVWMDILSRWSISQRQRWHDLCDPSVHLVGARLPMLFVTGTNDFAYPLPILQETASLAAGPVTYCVRHEMAHSHEDGWKPREIAWFADSIVRGGPPLPHIANARQEAQVVSAEIASALPLTAGWLLYTADTHRWQERKWHQLPATLSEGRVEVQLPDEAAVWMLAVQDERGAYASSRYALSNYQGV